MATLQKITPNLWFDQNAEEAVNFYVNVFPNSSIGAVTRFGHAGHDIHKMEAGTVMTIDFEIEGQQFVALNGGPVFQFSEAISFIVNCGTQEEIDYYWNALSEGSDPAAQQCGWLKDQFGLSWQIVPSNMQQLQLEADEEGRERLITAMLGMKKLDMAALEKAAKEKTKEKEQEAEPAV